MGHCPGLPAGQLALVLFADRIRTGIGRAGAVLRLHPAGSGTGGTGSGTGAIGSGGGTTLSGGTDPAPAPSQGGGSSSSSSSAPQPAPSAPQPASSGLCVKVGPLGVCLNV